MKILTELEEYVPLDMQESPYKTARGIYIGGYT